MESQTEKINRTLKLIEVYINLYENDLKDLKLSKRELLIYEIILKDLNKIKRALK